MKQLASFGELLFVLACPEARLFADRAVKLNRTTSNVPRVHHLASPDSFETKLISLRSVWG
ncbi:hypothetical protein Back11_50180 [Paenibacillus baekrokdamisoli]|uniref:Uncharacterized protein n=1 Tax=Paenibacillus baekrokdamisoli TaxID=1712516 RepID=A0A3G9JFC6_9BACL|nr:hypothetical protein Back11_50180 [Paenibacillus baekrokdamisoli]